MEITKELLLEKFDYDKATGLLFRKKTEHGRKAGDVAGYVKKSDGYRYVKINNKAIGAHRLIWFIEKGYWSTMDIDHINTNRSDNRIENLREATRSQNLHNCSVGKLNTHGCKGIRYQVKGKRKWCARIMHNYKSFYLGVFYTKEEAIAAYKKKSIELLGEFSGENA